MNTKILKKVRARYTTKWVGVTAFIALDNKNKIAEKWGGTGDFVCHMAYKFFGLGTFFDRREKVLKRRNTLNYYKHKNPEKYTWLKL